MNLLKHIKINETTKFYLFEEKYIRIDSDNGKVAFFPLSELKSITINGVDNIEIRLKHDDWCSFTFTCPYTSILEFTIQVMDMVDSQKIIDI